MYRSLSSYHSATFFEKHTGHPPIGNHLHYSIHYFCGAALEPHRGDVQLLLSLLMHEQGSGHVNIWQVALQNLTITAFFHLQLSEAPIINVIANSRSLWCYIKTISIRLLSLTWYLCLNEIIVRHVNVYLESEPCYSPHYLNPRRLNPWLIYFWCVVGWRWF